MKQYSILVVDDMPRNLNIIIDFLKDSGLNFKILKAPNGKIACDIADKKMPNLIITDWDMPVMDGIEAIKWLKKNKRTRDIPIIVTSGAMTLPVDVKTALEFGAVDYIKKPVNKIELIARVNSMLNLFESNKKIKLLYEELRATNEQLFSQQEELKATLNQLTETQSQLVQSEKMASMGVLLAGITHEINNPLNYIQGGETVLKMYVKENLSNYLDDILPMLEMIETGVERTSNIVNSLNILKQRNTEENKNCDIHHIINNSIQTFQNQIFDRISIVKNYTSNSYNLIGNESELFQVFVNTLTNAVQAITEKGTISITTQANKDKFIVQIADTGYGIKKEDIKRITDPFFTTKPPREGAGLGMSIAYNIIQKHKGSIKYSSIEGNGTTVTISFPI